MLKTDYNIPIFEDTDAADLNEYSNEIANALKTQINNTNNEIKEIDKKVVDAVNKFGNPLSYKGQVSTIQDLPTGATNGDIYNVTSENKNYIYNGTEWVEYSSTLDLTYLENNTKTTQTTEVSEILTITDCAPVSAKLDIKSGKTIQAEGEPSPDNIIPIRNVGDNINEFDGELEVGTINTNDGQNTVNANCVRSKNFQKVNPSENYILSNDKNYGYVYYLYNKDYTFIKALNQSNILSLTEDTRYIKFRSIPGNTENDLNVKYKLEKGSTPTPYTPYNCGSADFKVENKNKLPNTATSQTQAGVTFTINEDSSVIANGTATGNINFYINESFPLLAGDYILSGCPDGGSSTTYRLIAPNVINLGGDTSFSLSEDKSNFNAYINIKSGVTVNNLVFKPMLRKADIEDDTYIPYQEKIVSFPFTEGQVLHKGDYLASDGIHQKRKTLVLDGTENWGVSSDATNCFGIYLNNYITDIQADISTKNCISSHFKATDFNSRYAEPNKISGRTYSIVLTFELGKFVNLAEAKAWLAEQYANGTPVIIEYELAEEIVIPYTEEQEEAYYELQHLLMYEGYTSIECIDEIKPDIQLTYWYNNELNKSYGERFDKVEDSINELENINLDFNNKLNKKADIIQVGDIYKGEYKGMGLIESDNGDVIVFTAPINMKTASNISSRFNITVNNVFIYSTSGRTLVTHKVAQAELLKAQTDNNNWRIKITFSEKIGTAWSYCGVSLMYTIKFQ